MPHKKRKKKKKEGWVTLSAARMIARRWARGKPTMIQISILIIE
jgi:hypothetical protein